MRHTMNKRNGDVGEIQTLNQKKNNLKEQREGGEESNKEYQNNEKK